MSDEDYAAAIEALLARRSLLDALHQIIWSDTGDGAIDYFNRRWYEVTGLHYDDADSASWIEPIHPDDQQRAWNEYQISRLTDGPHESEIRLRHRDGAYRWSLMRSVALRDADGRPYRWFGTVTDIHDLKMAEQSQSLLIRELSHRLKNAFTLVGAIASSTARAHPEARAFVEEFQSRLAALSKASDLALDESGKDASIRLFELIATLAKAYVHDDGPALILEGEDMCLGQRTASLLALVLHEQITNAAKYGAFSRSGGKIRIECRSDGQRVELRWTESGGPSIDHPPGHSGFGTSVIDRSLASQLGGRLDREWNPDGLRFKLTMAAVRLTE